MSVRRHRKKEKSPLFANGVNTNALAKVSLRGAIAMCLRPEALRQASVAISILKVRNFWLGVNN
jgi:hypothetical protein